MNTALKYGYIVANKSLGNLPLDFKPIIKPVDIDWTKHPIDLTKHPIDLTKYPKDFQVDLSKLKDLNTPIKPLNIDWTKTSIDWGENPPDFSHIGTNVINDSIDKITIPSINTNTGIPVVGQTKTNTYIKPATGAPTLTNVTLISPTTPKIPTPIPTPKTVTPTTVTPKTVTPTTVTPRSTTTTVVATSNPASPKQIVDAAIAKSEAESDQWVKGLKNWQVIAIGVVAVGAVGGGIYFATKKPKKKTNNSNK